MPRAAKPHRQAGKKSTAEKLISPSKLRELREQAKEVRRAVEDDKEQIAAEAHQAIDEAVNDERLIKLSVLLRPDEKVVLEAVDRYAAEHGLKSRNQVLRAALARLLDISLDQPHWGWPAGRRRS